MANPYKDTSSTNAGAPTGAPSSSVHSSSGLGAQGIHDAEEALKAELEGEDVGTSEAKSQMEDATDGEEVLDAVLEAEAAAIVDNAMDEVQAEADASAAQKEASEWKDKYMRLHAEWDTYRRRNKEQAEQQKALAAEKLVTSLIPVIDDLERTIDYAEKNGEGGLLDGVKAVLNKFVDTLVKDGVDVINPEGEAFDALEAQAVGTVDDSEQFNETVADVYQKGYKIGNKVLRPAMVTVTTGGPARPKEENAEE